MKFRPCIDLHDGKVKQIVGSSLVDEDADSTKTNFESEKPAAFYAEMYKRDNLPGGHVIKLGPNNDEAARSALKAYPNGLQLGGGVTADNASYWLDQGAAKVIVTSAIFENGDIHWGRLEEIVTKIGKDNLVLDLSCRKRGQTYYVVADRWQSFTSLDISEKTLTNLSRHCAEYLVHAVDVEGKQQGIDEELLSLLARWSPLPTTYAGGVKDMSDVLKVRNAGQGRIDVTVGSALDIFGGSGVRYQDMISLKNT